MVHHADDSFLPLDRRHTAWSICPGCSASHYRFASRRKGKLPRTYELDDDGITLLSEFDHQCQELRNESQINAVKALKNKSAGKALRIAGLLHILHCQQNGQYSSVVPVQRLQEAILLISTLDDWTSAFHASAQLEKHAAYAVNNRQQMLRRIHEIAGKSKGEVSWNVIRQGLKSAEKKTHHRSPSEGDA